MREVPVCPLSLRNQLRIILMDILLSMDYYALG